jgi:hypothetical protein
MGMEVNGGNREIFTGLKFQIATMPGFMPGIHVFLDDIR